MKINSENLWKYINELAANEKVKLNVYFNDEYVTQIYWNGYSFEWEPGRFTSEAFFNPLYDFIAVEQEKKMPDKLNNFTIAVGSVDDSNIEEYIQKLFKQQYEIFNKINSIIDYLKSKGE